MSVPTYIKTVWNNLVTALGPTNLNHIETGIEDNNLAIKDLEVNKAIVGGGAIINGNFAINQRVVSGSVVLSAGEYGHDRFRAGSGGCTYTFTTALNVTTITISAGTLEQEIEGVNLESGTYILSWIGTTTAQIDAGGFGASGITEALVGGTNSTIEFGTGTVAQVKLEKGEVATDYIPKTEAEELLDCQRYFVIYGGLLDYRFINGYTISPTFYQFSITLPNNLRTVPTIILSNIGIYTVANAVLETSFNPTALDILNIGGILQFRIATTGQTPGTAIQMVITNATISTYYVSFDAEL